MAPSPFNRVARHDGSLDLPVRQALDPEAPVVNPNFIVIGQAKCGTTTVYEALRSHPQVFVTEPKEPHYFTYVPSRRDPEWYASLFSGVTTERAIGEGSTSYTRPDIHERCARDIHKAFPDIRLIYMARDPVARLESDWKMRVREGRATWNDINQSLDDNPQVVELGKYWRNLSTYRELFSDEQLLMLSLEDYARAPEKVMARIHRHIGVDEVFEAVGESAALNTAASYRQDGLVMGLARRSGLLEAGRALLPQSLIQSLKTRFSSPYRYEANWDPVRLRDLQQMYRETSKPFLEHCGKPLDYWSYEARELPRGAKEMRLA